MTHHVEPKCRLESWKEVAAYFGRADRTVKRWEAERGLPIRRLPGSPKSRIYAEIAELEAWRSSQRQSEEQARGGADQTPASPNASPDGSVQAAVARRSVRTRLLILTGAVAAAAFVVACLFRPPLGFAPTVRHGDDAVGPPPLAAQRLYIAGMDDWAARTPASLNRAVDEFRGAIGLFPAYGEAWAGLAGCYDLLREYTLMPSVQAYTLARGAATRALQLDDRLASAHAALAFADYFGFWDARSSETHFARAIDLDPANATARQWYATFLLESGRPLQALSQIEAALALEPASPSIGADRALALHYLGRDTEAIGALKQLERVHPTFLSPYNYLAEIDFDRGDDLGFLSQSAAAARLTRDTCRTDLLAAARRALRAGGHAAMAHAIYATSVDQFQAGVGTAYAIARAAARMGDRDDSLRYLSLAVDRREDSVIALAIDEAFDALRGDADFQAVRRRM